MSSSDQVDEVVTLALRLSPLEKVRLVERIVATLHHSPGERSASLRALYGVLAHLGSAPTAEDIESARREAWSAFPREDLIE